MTFKRDELLVASEVARYAYCQRAWWYDLKVRSRRRISWLPLPVMISSLMIIASFALIIVGLQ
jgi:hypothetical protein